MTTCVPYACMCMFCLVYVQQQQYNVLGGTLLLYVVCAARGSLKISGRFLRYCMLCVYTAVDTAAVVLRVPTTTTAGTPAGTYLVKTAGTAIDY